MLSDIHYALHKSILKKRGHWNIIIKGKLLENNLNSVDTVTLKMDNNRLTKKIIKTRETGGSKEAVEEN